MKYLRLVNVRSFADSGDIAIAPITLLLGQNSSGKSTFARIFPLLRQTAETPTREPVLWYGRFVDFGSVNEVFSKFDAEGSMGFEFEFPVERMALARRRRFLIRTEGRREYCPVNVTLLHQIVEQEVEYVFGMKFFDEEISLRVRGDEVKSFKINDVDYSGIVRGNMLVSNWLACFPNISYKAMSVAYSDSNPFAVSLKKIIKSNFHGKSGAERIENFARELISAPLDDFFRRVKNSHYGDSKWIRTVKPWTDKSPPFVRMKELVLGARFAELVDICSSHFSAACARIRYITPIRASAERYYRHQGLALGEVDPQGQNVAMFIHNLPKEERKKFADWMGKEFGFFVDTQVFQGHVSMVVKERDETLSFNLADTGFGFSQLIPILIQVWLSITSEGRVTPHPRIISIEQPELHLHPKLQAKLADVLIKAVKVAQENGVDLRFVVETHSEQIINRVGRRIADFDYQITPKQVNVVLFEKESFGLPTKVTQTSYDNEGLLEKWPYGFFESEV